jgi:hypothetical protein
MMFPRTRRRSLVLGVGLLTAGVLATIAGPASASPAPSGVSWSSTPGTATRVVGPDVVAAATTHHTRLWTRAPGGHNGYADVTHAFTPVGGGFYAGKLTGGLHHYRAPRDRNVVLQFRVDGTLGGIVETHDGKNFTKKYGPPGRSYKKVSVRICLHRSGATIHLNSGVSYCGAWWG